MVSILMPVYNGEKYLDEAVQSILSQSLGDFELITIDDGSTDGTRCILEGYAQRDGRVIVFTQENCGLVTTLNRGLNLARGKYLARMDADDISMLDRLGKQAAFMEQNLEVVLLGTTCVLAREDGSKLRIENPPFHDTTIRWQILFDNPFIHSSVMIRLEVIRQLNLEYRSQAVLAEDYDLWSRLLDFGQGFNLDAPLVVHRFHSQQISMTGIASQISGESATKIAQANIQKLGVQLSEEQVNSLRIWSHHFPKVLSIQDQALCLTLLDILDTFSLQPGLDRKQVRLVRGRVVLRMLMARSDEPGGFQWKYRLLRRLPPSDFAWVVQYVLHRRNSLGKIL